MKNEFKYIKPWENARKYSVKHSIEVKENGALKNSEVSFNLIITCLPTINPNNLYWKIERENFLLNGESPETPHMQMFIGAEESIFPLSVEISDQGKFLGIDDFFNWRNETSNRLEKVKSQFEGFYAEDFIKRFQEEIQTESLLKKKLLGLTVFNILFFNPFDEKPYETIDWNLLKIGTYPFEGNLTSQKIEDKLTETTFESLNSINSLIRPGKELEEFESKFQFIHQFNPFSGHTQKKGCDVILNSKDTKFSYQENIKMEFQGLRIEKSIPIREVKQKSFFLSEKEEIKK